MSRGWMRDLAIVIYYLHHNEEKSNPAPRVSYQEMADAFGLTKGRICQIIDASGDGRIPEHETYRIGCLIHSLATADNLTLETLVVLLRDIEPW